MFLVIQFRGLEFALLVGWYLYESWETLRFDTPSHLTIEDPLVTSCFMHTTRRSSSTVSILKCSPIYALDVTLLCLREINYPLNLL